MVNRKIFLFLILGLFLISFSSAALTDDIISYWKLDDSSGDAIDELNSNDFSMTGVTYSVSGIINTAFQFDGTNDFGVVADNPSQSPSDNMSISLWAYFDTIKGQGLLEKYESTGDERAWNFEMDATGHLTWTTSPDGGVGVSTKTSTGTLTTGQWYHLVVVYDKGDSVTFYVNGTEFASTGSVGASIGDTTAPMSIGSSQSGDSNRIHGRLDEIGLWDKALSGLEVTDLYNSGNGSAYPFTKEILIVLESPENNSVISDIGTNFTVSGDVTEDFNVTNITYFIWNNDTSLHNQTTVILDANQLFNETLFIDDFILGDFFWNAEICFENSTFSNCTFAENNFTFSVNVFKDISLSYETEITEGSLNSINRTISVFPGNTITSALLEYNGTNYTTSLLFSSGVYKIVSSTVAPTVNIDTNFTFKFHYLINGIYYESDEANQTVLNTLFGICGGISNDTLLNLFLLDEELKTLLTGDIEINADILSMTSDEVVGSLNNTFTNVNNVSICFTPPSVYASYYLNAEIRYGADGHTTEFYYIQNSDLEDYPSNLSLFSLNLTDSTEFTVTYKNNAFIFIEGAIIQLQRKYIGENIYEVVEAPITSTGGEAVLHIDLNTNKYRASVVKDGVLLDFFDNIVFSCANELSGDCTYVLDGTVNPNNDVSIEDITDFSYSISIDEDAQEVTVLFAVPSGNPSSINILLEQIDMFGNLTSCNTTVVTSAGSITCGYTDTIEKSILELSISKDDVQLVVLSFVNDPELDMDGMNFFIVFLFMISLVGMAIASPEWMIIISVMVIMIAGTMLLLNGVSLVMGLGAIAWVIVAAAIIIMKMAKQEDR